MHFTVGMTGGIGSGKSAASDWFAAQGICIVDADLVSREVVTAGQPALLEIEQYFGSSVIQTDGTLNRAQLRKIIFNSPDAKLKLESITHPRIRLAIVKQLAHATSPYALLVSPLLFETDQHLLVQRTLLIDTTEALQIQRASERDQQSIQQIEKIIKAQMPREQKQQRADDIILNNSTYDALYQKLHLLHQHYLILANNS